MLWRSRRRISKYLRFMWTSHVHKFAHDCMFVLDLHECILDQGSQMSWGGRHCCHRHFMVGKHQCSMFIIKEKPDMVWKNTCLLYIKFPINNTIVKTIRKNISRHFNNWYKKLHQGQNQIRSRIYSNGSRAGSGQLECDTQIVDVSSTYCWRGRWCAVCPKVTR